MKRSYRKYTGRASSTFKVFIWSVVVILFLQACEKEDEEALMYYSYMKAVNNEIVYQIYKSLHETKMVILSEPIPQKGIDSRDYYILKRSYDSISSICERSINTLNHLGPLRNDSILYTTYLQSLELIREINRKEFATVLECMKNGELNDCRINALYEASMKIADNHVLRLDSIIQFNNRYGLQIDTIELNLSKNKARKFKADMIRLHSSKCIWGNCLNGYGQQEDKDGAVYTGNFKNGFFHGKGSLNTPDGNTYVGNFKFGEFEGKGKLIYTDGKRYIGEWREGKINGIGTMYFASGDSLYGYWENGQLTDL